MSERQVQIMAARLRVTIASRRGDQAPDWVTKLAAEPLRPGDRPWRLDPELTKRPWWRFK